MIRGHGQVTFLISTLDKVVQADGQAQVVEAALLLQNGFEQLRNKEDPRKRADLLRYIEKMEEPLVWASRNARPLCPASFDHTLRLFKEANVGAEDPQALLNKIEVKSKNNSLAKIMCQSPGQASFTRSL
jgi:hypothetical protein